MKTVTQQELQELIRQKALALGFDDIGFCSAAPFEQWLKNAYDPLPKRIAHDPKVLLGTANTIIVAVKRYEAFGRWPEGTATVSHYYVNSNIGFAEIRKLGAVLTEQGWSAVVSPSLPAKQAAVRAGLGVQGINTQFCHSTFGTLVSLHMILTNATLAGPDSPYEMCVMCGSCAANCPSGALSGSHFDHGKCLRFYMANGSVVPLWARELMGMRLIGCTECQHACPKADVKLVEVPDDLVSACGLDGLLAGEPEQIDRLAGYIGKNFAHPRRIRQQAAICAGNSANRDFVPRLAMMLKEDDPVLRIHASWSLGRLGGEEARAALAATLATEHDGEVYQEMEAALEKLARQ